MRWAGVALMWLALLAVAYGSGRATVCNYRRWQHGRRTAPLDGLDLRAATLSPLRPPKTWPEVETVEDPAHAAAYASLADDRALNYAMAGEAAVVVGSVAFGVLLTGASSTLDWLLPLGGALFSAVFAMAFRLRATRSWAIGGRYRQRYAVLTATPEPPAPVPSFLGRLLGRA